MNTRRITLTVAAAGGGLLAAAFLQTAVALADDDYNALISMAPPPAAGDTYTFASVPVTDYQPHVEYTDGIAPAYQNVLGYDEFNWIDESQSSSGSPDIVGTFNADTSDITTAFGVSNEELLVDQSDLSGIHPAIGSVFDITNFGGGFENFYSDLVGAGTNGANLISDMFDTPFGDFAIPVTYDAAADVIAGSYFP